MIEEICLNCQHWVLNECHDTRRSGTYKNMEKTLKKYKRYIYFDPDENSGIEISLVTDPTFSCSKFEERKEVKSNG